MFPFRNLANNEIKVNISFYFYLAGGPEPMFAVGPLHFIKEEEEKIKRDRCGLQVSGLRQAELFLKERNLKRSRKVKKGRQGKKSQIPVNEE